MSEEIDEINEKSESISHEVLFPTSAFLDDELSVIQDEATGCHKSDVYVHMEQHGGASDHDDQEEVEGNGHNGHEGATQSQERSPSGQQSGHSERDEHKRRAHQRGHYQRWVDRNG